MWLPKVLDMMKKYDHEREILSFTALSHDCLFPMCHLELL